MNFTALVGHNQTKDVQEMRGAQVGGLDGAD